MICYLEYGTGATQVHLDLTNTDFTTESVQAGAFATPTQELTQTIVRLTIQGRPNIYAATTTLGDIMNQVQVSEGRTIGAVVYFYYQPAMQDVVYRAQVRGLAFTPAPGSGEYWKYARLVQGELTVIHTIWEGELTTLPLTNMHGTNITTGLQIDTTQDATHSNEALIQSTDIIGDAPTPAMIEMTKTAGTQGFTKILIGLNIYSDPNNFQQVYEGEDYSQLGGVTGSSVAADATFSAGDYLVLDDVNVGSYTWVDWDLTAAQLGYAAGNQFHVLFRGGQFAGDDIDECYAHLDFAVSHFTFWSSEPYYIDDSSGIFNLAVIRIPPWRVDDEGVDGTYQLRLRLNSDDGLSKRVTIDAVHLWPIDGYREIYCIGVLVIDDNERCVDDMIEDRLYADSGAGTGQSKMLVALGSTINLQPGKDQKLYFIAHPHPLTYTMTVIVKYRPRRLAL